MDLLTVAGVTAVISFVLTLILQYVPGLRVKWAGVKSEIKALIFLGGYFIVGAVVGFGGCAAFIASLIPGLLCVDAPTFFEYIFAVLMAMGAGQGMFGLLPSLPDVQAAKAERAY